MGRRSSKPGAIPRFRVRPQKSGTVYYYYDHGVGPDGKRIEEPLGRDYGLAIQRWAELERSQNAPDNPQIMFAWVCDRYMAEIAIHKARRTLAANRSEIKNLKAFFNDPPAPLDAIQPVNIRQYLTWRTRAGSAHVSANREKALLSHIWNFARNRGYTALPNPCAGIKGHREKGRDVYVEDDQYRALWNAADACLREAMDLAYLTGQRPGDILSLTIHDIRDGALHVHQSKTQAKLRIEVTGALAELLQRIQQRKRSLVIFHTTLIVDERGQPLSQNQLRYRFDKARRLAGIAKADVQFRDLRAKAATDKADSAGDARQAQRQLGHSSITTTERYLRQRRGAKVTPTK